MEEMSEEVFVMWVVCVFVCVSVGWLTDDLKTQRDVSLCILKTGGGVRFFMLHLGRG